MSQIQVRIGLKMGLIISWQITLHTVKLHVRFVTELYASLHILSITDQNVKFDLILGVGKYHLKAYL